MLPSNVRTGNSPSRSSALLDTSVASTFQPRSRATRVNPPRPAPTSRRALDRGLPLPDAATRHSGRSAAEGPSSRSTPHSSPRPKVKRWVMLKHSHSARNGRAPGRSTDQQLSRGRAEAAEWVVGRGPLGARGRPSSRADRRAFGLLPWSAADRDRDPLPGTPTRSSDAARYRPHLGIASWRFGIRPAVRPRESVPQTLET